ncbi:MAG: hypothetical protein K5930_10495 [Treponemataceae bacterium]|nr:hypothetical protein [Treponemataceae bacterium]
MLSRYKNWVKSAERPDEADFLVLPFGVAEKRRKAVLNITFCILLLFLQIFGGSLNQSSSRTAWIFYPYVILFLPIAYFFSGALFFFKVSESLSRKEWEKSLARCKHSGIALLVLSALNAVLELVYIILNRGALFASASGALSGALPGVKAGETLAGGISGLMDIIYLAVFIFMSLVCLLYGIFFDRNFSRAKPVL